MCDKALNTILLWNSQVNSDVNNGRSSDMTDCFYVAVGHLKFEI